MAATPLELRFYFLFFIFHFFYYSYQGPRKFFICILITLGHHNSKSVSQTLVIPSVHKICAGASAGAGKVRVRVRRG